MKVRDLLIAAATVTTMSISVGSAPVRAGSDEPSGFIGVDVGSKAELSEQGCKPAASYAMGDGDSGACGGSTMAARLHADVDLAMRTMAEHFHLIPLREAPAGLVEGAPFVDQGQLMAHPGIPFPFELQLMAQATGPFDAVSSFRVAEDSVTVPGTLPVPGTGTTATPSSPKANAVGTVSTTAEKAPKAVTGTIAGTSVNPLDPALSVEKAPSVETTPVGVTIYRGSGAP